MASERAHRDYEKTSEEVRSTYRAQHRHQTLAFAREKAADFGRLNRRRQPMWEALLELDGVIDESDPDTGLSQLEHALQTAESLRREGAPEWLQLTGLVHDAGKMLCLFGEEQWAVVGDTFPLGCPFSEAIIFHEFFDENPDRKNPQYDDGFGIYGEGCGLEKVTMAWGHDEYLYRVLQKHLPEDALFVIRFHSFYALHGENAYDWMLDARDRERLSLLRRFQAHDLYSKTPDRPDFAALSRHYRPMVESWLPKALRW